MRVYYFILFILLIHQNSFANEKIENILIQLDQVIFDRDIYQKEKEQNILILKALLSNDPNKNDLFFRYKIYEKIYDEYKSFRYDSAFHYANKLLITAYQLGDSLYIDRSRIKLSFTLVSAGMFKESIDTLMTIKNPLKMTDLDNSEYYSVLSRIYSDLGDYAEDNHYVPIYNQLVIHYQDLLLSYLDENSPVYLQKKGDQLTREDKIPEAIATLHKLLDNHPLPNNIKAQVTSNLGILYKANNQHQKAVEYFALATMSDIKAAVKETVAVRELAKLLYEQGDLKRAYSYVQLAMEDASFYNAKHRKVQISFILPLIGDKQLQMVDDQRKMLLNYSIAITALSLLVIIFAVIILKQFSKLNLIRANLAESHHNLQNINFKLQEVNKIKEEYIGQFFNSISEYIDKIERFKINLTRKVSSRKIDDINDIINGINSNKERERLFLNFDTTFLKIFPSFIDRINDFFEEGDKFVIKEHQPLSPELRIFALIRLGINENEKIAKILGYSVNTIYTYKTKIKKKSKVANEDFEQKIMEIRGL